MVGRSVATLCTLVVAACGQDRPSDGDPEVARPAARDAVDGCAPSKHMGVVLDTMLWHGSVESRLPSVVAIGHRSSSGAVVARCSGVVIAPDRVLTASHCFAGCDEGELWVTDDVDAAHATPDRVSAVTRIVRHHGYRVHERDALGKIFDNDLAVVEVSGAGFQPWPRDRIGSIDGAMTAMKVGYGWTARCDSASRGVRLSGIGSLRPTSDPASPGFLFVRPLAVCKFDSGGASFEVDARDEPVRLVGITSTMTDVVTFPGGVPCSQSALDVAVAPYRDWIDQTLEGRCSCSGCP